MVTGTLAVTSTTVLGVIGTSLVTTNGTVIDVTSLTALGIAPWSLPVPLTAAGSSVSLFAFSTGTEYVLFWVPTTSGASGWRQPAYTPSWVSVPLSNSLTIGATYHLVLSATNDLTTGVAVPVVTPSSGSAGQIFNGATWEPLNGAVPFLAFYDANEGGMPFAFVASGKTTLMWFDTPSGALTTTVEIVDGTSISRLLTYSDGVLSEVA